MMNQPNSLKVLIVIIIGMSMLLSSGCDPAPKPSGSIQLVDDNATYETRALYQNLMDLKGAGVMFGHQDDLAYGYTWWSEAGRSDVMEVSGSYPAIYGWDLGNIADKQDANLDGINFKKMRGWIREGYERGGIITFSWHILNPVTGGSSWDTVPTIEFILPGAEYHEAYVESLDIFADFALSLTAEGGELIPVIFRPFHEHNGDWFWWGKDLNTEEDYVSLWQFTVQYLRDTKGVHNLLWAFSPDRSRADIDRFKEEYFYGYPGDEYVDIIGIDNYWDVGHPANNTDLETQQEQFIRSLTYTAQIADSLGKVAALSETGTETLPDSTIWTEKYLSALQANEWTRQIAYMLVWRNATYERENRDHFYAPYPGQISAVNFKRFKETEFMLFEDELPDMYAPQSDSDK